MGAAASAHGYDASLLNNDELAMAKVMMPLYFTDDPLTEGEKTAAKMTFNLITSDQCQRFFLYKQDHPTTECKTAADFMHACFFARLFSIHPSCKPMFANGTKNMNLIPIISMFFNSIDNISALREQLKPFVDSHTRMGVKTVEFGIAGECAMHGIRAAVGPEIYTEEAGNGWCKIFSCLLAIIIPAAMKYELDNAEIAQEQSAARVQMVKSSVDQCVTCVRLQAEFDTCNCALIEQCAFCVRASSGDYRTISSTASVQSLGTSPRSVPALSGATSMHAVSGHHIPVIAEAAPAAPAVAAPVVAAPVVTAPVVAASVDPPADQTRPTEPASAAL